MKITNITVCKLPYQDHAFVHADLNGRGAWLSADGSWTFEDGDPLASLPMNPHLSDLAAELAAVRAERDGLREIVEYVKAYRPEVFGAALLEAAELARKETE